MMNRKNNSRLTFVAAFALGACGGNIGDEAISSSAATGNCICPHTGGAVCGVNGVTYQDGCVAQCANVAVAYYAACGSPGLPETLEAIDPNVCDFVAGLHPFSNENGHLVAVEMPTGSAPLRINTVQYSLVSSVGISFCDDSIPQRISLWVQDTSFPDATPSLAFTEVSNPVPTTGAPNSFYDFHLSTPIVVGPNKRLFVSLEMLYLDNTHITCLASCITSGTALTGVTYWSNAPAPPYPWYDLGLFVAATPLISVVGERLPGQSGPPAF